MAIGKVTRSELSEELNNDIMYKSENSIDIEEIKNDTENIINKTTNIETNIGNPEDNDVGGGCKPQYSLN